MMIWIDIYQWFEQMPESIENQNYFSCFVTDISMSKAVTTQISNETVSDM